MVHESDESAHESAHERAHERAHGNPHSCELFPPKRLGGLLTCCALEVFLNQVISRSALESRIL